MLEQDVVVICFCIKSNVKSNTNMHAIKTDCFIFKFNVIFLIHVSLRTITEDLPRPGVAEALMHIHLHYYCTFSKDPDCAGVLNNAGHILLFERERCDLC